MSIGNSDILSMGQPARTKAEVRGPGRLHAAQGKVANSASQEVNESSVVDNSGRAALQALVSSVQGEFRQMGMIPPPHSFGGISVVSASDILRLAEADSDEMAAPKLGTLDCMRMIMIKNLLTKIAGESSAPAAEPTATPQLNTEQPPETEPNQLDMVV